MAIHPDDSPFMVFGVPRIVSNYAELKYIRYCCPSPNNGSTFCSGSLGASAENDLIRIIKDFGDKIHFIHLRDVKRSPDGSFYEAGHLKGNVGMEEVLAYLTQEQQRRAAHNEGIGAIPMRPDHGHGL